MTCTPREPPFSLHPGCIANTAPLLTSVSYTHFSLFLSTLFLLDDRNLNSANAAILNVFHILYYKNRPFQSYAKRFDYDEQADCELTLSVSPQE